MDKLVCESLDSFLAEKKWGDEDNPGGPVSNAFKAIRSAPARALRRKRARSIMQKYKLKIEGKIDEILQRYMKNASLLEDKIAERVNRVKASSMSEDAKSHQYDDILDDLRSSMEGILRSAREAVNEYIKTYEDSFQQRLDRPGSITGTQFMPEDKTNLLSEWKSVIEELNYYIQTRLLDFVDLVSISELSGIKSELKQFIEDQRGYKGGWNNSQDSDPSSIIDPDEQKVWQYFENIVGRNVDNAIKMKYPTRWSSNTAGFPYFKYEIGRASCRERV